MAVAEIQDQCEINRESLETPREDGILLEGEHLALRVDVKFDAGRSSRLLSSRSNLL